MNSRFNFREELRRSGNCRRLQVAVEISTNRLVIVASYNDDGFVEGWKEVEVLRTLADCRYVVRLIEHEEDDLGTRSKNRDPKTATAIAVAYEHLDTDLTMFRRAMRDMRLPENTLKTVFHQLAMGLRAAHSARIFLRDLRPEKIRVSVKPFLVKLSDFAGAKIVHPYAGFEDAVTPPGALERCLSYQAPEQLIGSAKYGKEVDMWALGCIMVEMATGQVLFPADPTSHPRTHLQNIYRCLGTPSENPYPSDVKDQWDTQKTFRPTLNLYARLLTCFGQSGSELVMGLLCFDPEKRTTAERAVGHDYFKDIEVV